MSYVTTKNKYDLQTLLMRYHWVKDVEIPVDWLATPIHCQWDILRSMCLDDTEKNTRKEVLKLLTCEKKIWKTNG